MIRGLTRHDAADRDFFERVRQTFVTAEQAQRHLTGAGTGGSAEAARWKCCAVTVLSLILAAQQNPGRE